MLNSEDKTVLSHAAARVQVGAIVSNGRAGSLYLQSLFDQDDEVISTRIYLLAFDGFIREHKDLATTNPAFFAHISLIILRKSANPDTAYLEGWDKMFNGPIMSADSLVRYVDALTYLLRVRQRTLNSNDLVKFIHIAYAFSLHEDVASARVILHHAHHWSRLNVFQGEGSKLIKVLSCSRNVFDISVSGVLAGDTQDGMWRPQGLTGLGGKLERAAGDSVAHQSCAPDSDVRTVMLDHLRHNLDYLNSVRQFLNLRNIDRFPEGTVYGRVFAGDSLSSPDSVRGNSVRRSRLGGVDTLRISLCSKYRRSFYFGSGDQKKVDFLPGYARFIVLLASFLLVSSLELEALSRVKLSARRLYVTVQGLAGSRASFIRAFFLDVRSHKLRNFIACVSEGPANGS